MQPVIKVDKTGPATINEGGDSAVYSYTVTSQSASTDLLTVALIDDNGTPSNLLDDFNPTYKSGDTNGNTLLDSNETWIYTATKSLTLNAGQTYTNTATVTGTDDEGNTVSATDSHTITAIDLGPGESSITIDKQVDANKDNTFNDSESMLNVDGMATYRYQVVNTSVAGPSDPLTIDTLKDDCGTTNSGDDKQLVVNGVLQPGVTVDKSGGNTDTNTLLDVGETWTYQWTTVPSLSASMPSNTNTATVIGQDDEGNTVTDNDTARVDFASYGLIAPTNTTVEQYIAGETPAFSQYYADQNGVIQYNVGTARGQNKIVSVNPGVFFYRTGLSGAIKAGMDWSQVLIDQSDNSPDLGAFTTTKNNVKLYQVSDLNNTGHIDEGDAVVQKQLKANQIDVRADGDVLLSNLDSTLESPCYYVIEVKYATSSVVGTTVKTLPGPIATYKFNTDIGSDGIVDETALGGVKIEPKVKTLTLRGDAITGGEVLTNDGLSPVVGAAVNYWAAQGTSNADLRKLRHADVLIGDLGGISLGGTDGINIYVDDDAAGHGWSVSPGRVEAGKVDLFSAVVHEFGHMLGYEHDVMGATLGVGERHLPFEPGNTSRDRFQIGAAPTSLF